MVQSVAAHHGWDLAVRELPSLEQGTQEHLAGRVGGAVTLAVGMAKVFCSLPGLKQLMSYWYHFIIMFEALFILTLLETGTRVARFVFQESATTFTPRAVGGGKPRWGNEYFVERGGVRGVGVLALYRKPERALADARDRESIAGVYRVGGRDDVPVAVCAKAPVCVLHRYSVCVLTGDGASGRRGKRSPVVGADCDSAGGTGADVAADVRAGDGDAGLNGVYRSRRVSGLAADLSP